MRAPCLAWGSWSTYQQRDMRLLVCKTDSRVVLAAVCISFDVYLSLLLYHSQCRLGPQGPGGADADALPRRPRPPGRRTAVPGTAAGRQRVRESGRMQTRAICCIK